MVDSTEKGFVFMVYYMIKGVLVLLISVISSCSKKQDKKPYNMKACLELFIIGSVLGKPVLAMRFFFQ